MSKLSNDSGKAILESRIIEAVQKELRRHRNEYGTVVCSIDIGVGVAECIEPEVSDFSVVTRCEVDIVPCDYVTPPVSRFAGIAPNLTGDMSSDEFIYKNRDRWRSNR